MRRPIARVSVPITLIVSVALTWLFGGCGGRDVTVGIANEAGAPIFAAPDASAEEDATDGILSYCPSNKCPDGWTTCPNSRFPCDVNILRDVDNCGACGNACPRNGLTDNFACNKGACVADCNANDYWLDCDGLPDNGCETSTSSNDKNCGACGKVCSDPAMPCVGQDDGNYDCGCPPDKRFCPTPNPRCVPKSDNDNCGACGLKCPTRINGAPAPPNATYGCENEQCGALKCKGSTGNCDGRIENGCETPLDTNDNCGACGNACPDGQACRVGLDAKVRCMCPPGRTFCAVGTVGNLEAGECVDVATDQDNCGACGVSCADMHITNYADSSATCRFGSCVAVCNVGFADCNHSEVDGCEVNTNSDPRNCGGCGILCDAVAGQACVAGRCVVEPCSVDAGAGSAR